MSVPNVPVNQRNPYTVWFVYAKQNLSVFNAIAMKYHLGRLQPPLNIN